GLSFRRFVFFLGRWLLSNDCSGRCTFLPRHVYVSFFSIGFSFAFARSLFLPVPLVQTCKAILAHHVLIIVANGLLFRGLQNYGTDFGRFHPLFVQSINFFYPFGRKWYPVFLSRVTEPHQLFENIGFLKICNASLCLDTL